MKISRDTELDIAQMLIAAGFLKPVDFDRAYAARRDKGTPLIKLLLDDRVVEPDKLVAALEVRQEVSERRLPPACARSVLFLMGSCRLPLLEAMAKLGVEPVPNPWASSLDKLQAITTN
jgi:hypothetical protein